MMLHKQMKLLCKTFQFKKSALHTKKRQDQDPSNPDCTTTDKYDHSLIIGLTKDSKAISVTAKVVHLQNHISPVLPLSAGPI